MNREFARFIACILASLGLGISSVIAVQAITAPDCPTEDSCTANYYDGAWHIEEVNS